MYCRRILEWTRNAIIVVPHYIWREDLINPLDLPTILRPDASSTRFHCFRSSDAVRRETRYVPVFGVVRRLDPRELQLCDKTIM